MACLRVAAGAFGYQDLGNLPRRQWAVARRSTSTAFRNSGAEIRMILLDQQPRRFARR
jgi:hypothetical protein